MKLTISVLAFAAKLVSGASVRWLQGATPDTNQRVYFANHTSHLDALVLWASLPRELREITRPVAAKDYWEKGPVRRYIAKTFNALLIDRLEIKVHQSPIDLMIREMGDKYSLMIFPEGSRNTDEEMGELRAGCTISRKSDPTWNSCRSTSIISTACFPAANSCPCRFSPASPSAARSTWRRARIARRF
jgi:1-acyl-sn-glycerol-3-phosphate acyltransferase